MFLNTQENWNGIYMVIMCSFNIALGVRFEDGRRQILLFDFDEPCNFQSKRIATPQQFHSLSHAIHLFM
jgi:hypothetical protein